MAGMTVKLDIVSAENSLYHGEVTFFEVLYLSGGILEVQPTSISVLADVGLRADDIDEQAALEAKRHAEEKIANAGVDFDYEAATIELAKSIAQLKVVETIKKNITR